MPQLHVIIAGLTRLLAELIEDAITQQPGMAPVTVLDDLDDVVHCVERRGADALILRLGAERLQEFSGPLLRRFPALLVLSLANDDRRLLQCELQPTVREHGGVSIEQLIAYVQANAGPAMTHHS